MSRSRWLLALVVAVVAVACGLYFVSKSRTFQLFGTIVPRVETTRKLVALTFDDGPVPGRTRVILDRLAALGVRATFYVTGEALDRAPEEGRRIVQAGHELGNHSYSHSRMVLMSLGRVADEVERTDRAIRAAGQTGPITFRPPHCKKLFALPWYLWQTGRTTVTWDLEPDSSPADRSNRDRIVAHVLERVRPGSIVLLHVWYSAGDPSLEAVRPIVEGLRGRGFELVRVSDLVRATSAGR